MALNLFTKLLPDNTVNMENTTDTYFITALDSTTYNYILPPISTDGQHFRLVRLDNTTGIVNLVGTISYGGSTVASYTIGTYISLEAISLNSVWYVIEENSNVSTGLNNLFSAFYVNNNGNTYINYQSNSPMLSFPFSGTSNGTMINSILVTFGTPIVHPGYIQTLRLPNNSVLFTMSFTVTTTLYYHYFLTNANKATLPSSSTYLIVHSNYPPPGINISSIVIFS